MSLSNVLPQSNPLSLPDIICNGAFELLYCREEKVLKISWGNKVSAEDIAYGYEAAFMYLKTYGLTKILVTLPLSEPVSAEKMIWFFEEIVPKIIACTQTTTFMAMVVPVEFYNAISDDMVAVNFLNEQEMLVIDHFLLPEMGLDWLKTLG